MNTFIKVLYGPYEAHGIIRHKIQKIYGLKKYLTNNDFAFEVHPSPHLNRLTIEMNERVIYTCDIRYLKFNLPCEDDIHCQRIVDVINTHQSTFAVDTNVPKFADVAEGLRWQKYQEVASLVDTTLSDDMLGAPCNSLMQAELHPDDGDEWNLEQDLRRARKPSYFTFRQYVYNYGCFMQEPYESDESAAEMSTTSKLDTPASSLSISSTSSCACLSLDPPSLFSICCGPVTPLNTEMSQLKTEQNQLEVDEDVWNEILPSISLEEEMLEGAELEELVIGEDEDGLAFEAEQNALQQELTSQQDLAERLDRIYNAGYLSDREYDADVSESSVYPAAPSSSLQFSGKSDNTDASTIEFLKQPRVKVCKIWSGGKCSKSN